MQSTLIISKIKNSYFSYFLMYNFYYLSWALFSALISVYLIGLGYSAAQASFVVSVSFFTSMIAQPFMGSIADRYDLKKSCSFFFLIATLGGLFFLFARHLIAISILYSLVMVIMNGTNPIMESIATNSPYPYGKIRIWGTIGYAIGTQLAGFLYDAISPAAIFIAFIITMMLCVLGMVNTDPKTAKDQLDEEEKKLKIEEKTENKSLLTNKKYLYYLLVYALFAGVASASNTFVPAMFTHDGLDTSLTSTILSIAVLFETPIVFFAGKFMDKLTSKTLGLIAFSMIFVQMLAYGLDVNMGSKIVITLLAKHPAGMLFIMINLKIVASLVSPKQQLTALAIVATIKNLSSIFFNDLAGNMIDSFGFSDTFFVMALVMIVTIVLYIVFRLPKGTGQKLFS